MDNRVNMFYSNNVATMVTYNSGADGFHISEANRKRAKFPILKKSNNQVGVANGGVSAGKNCS